MAQIIAYREGSVTKESLCDLNCCHIKEQEEEIFHYIEEIYSDGSRKFIYEDKEGYSAFRENFEKNRMSSFHEFFTTETKQYEERGEISLPYYAARKDSDYQTKELAQVREELTEVPKLADRLTPFGKYDRRVNYHYAEGEKEQISEKIK